MFSSFIEGLKSFTPKPFILGAFFPLLAFVFVNGVLLQLVFAPFGKWADEQVSAGGTTLRALVALSSLGILAYVLWALNPFLRELLEGHSQTWWGESWLAGSLKTRQIEKLRRWRSELEEARAVRGDLKPDEWTERLAEAAQLGETAHPGRNTYDGTGPAARAVEDLRKTWMHGGRPTPGELEAAVTEFEAVLSRNDINAQASARRKKMALSEARRDLLRLFDYASDEWAGQEIAVARRLQVRFGDLAAVAPTALGNVAASMQSYAVSRYRLDLVTMWSRLQPLLEKHKDFYGGLENAKVQLDFLIASTWLCAATCALWIVALPILSGPWQAFLAVALLGPVITRLCYWAAVQSYITFADLVRTSVDLYRFDLLRALHIDVPSRLGHERTVWLALSATVWFGSEWKDIGYQHQAAVATDNAGEE